jgi:hypothetical protein
MPSNTELVFSCKIATRPHILLEKGRHVTNSLAKSKGYEYKIDHLSMIFYCPAKNIKLPYSSGNPSSG